MTIPACHSEECSDEESQARKVSEILHYVQDDKTSSRSKKRVALRTALAEYFLELD